MEYEAAGPAPLATVTPGQALPQDGPAPHELPPSLWRCRQQERPLQLRAKRGLDLLIAGIACLVSAPLMAVIALAIRCESRGPIVIAQPRVGRQGRTFRMYKFRSMVVDSDRLKAGLWSANESDGPLFKIRHDPRRTRVGQVIRRLSLDELPQFFNVLRGDMSLVGPRPALVDEVRQYEWHEARRLAGIPGLTGLWQVSGRSLLGFREMVALDLRYLDNWSLWLDIVILLRTIPAVLSGKGAW